jgi:hypothetical protein
MSNLNSISKACLVALLALFFSACEVVLINPLSDSATDKPDERLPGKWINKDEKGKGVYVQFDTGANRELNVSIFGGKGEEKNPAFTATTTTIGNRFYMSLYPTDEARDKGYLLARYEIKGDEMTVWLLDSEKVKAAITQKRLKGEAGQGSPPIITITDAADKVRAVLGSSESNELFKYLGTFERVNGK